MDLAANELTSREVRMLLVEAATSSEPLVIDGPLKSAILTALAGHTNMDAFAPQPPDARMIARAVALAIHERTANAELRHSDSDGDQR